jgi:hypothetical protein
MRLYILFLRHLFLMIQRAQIRVPKESHASGYQAPLAE